MSPLMNYMNILHQLIYQNIEKFQFEKNRNQEGTKILIFCC